MIVNGYKAMWVFVLFDLPVKTKVQRKKASSFRKDLLKDGFWMLQFSVYARPCPNLENAEVHEGRIKKILPPDGQVRIMIITDKQFGRMKVFFGKTRVKAENQPAQMELF